MMRTKKLGKGNGNVYTYRMLSIITFMNDTKIWRASKSKKFKTGNTGMASMGKRCGRYDRDGWVMMAR